MCALLSISLPLLSQNSEDGPSYYSSFDNREKVISTVIDNIKEEPLKTQDANSQINEFYSLVAKLNPDDAYFMLLDFYDGLFAYFSTLDSKPAKQKRVAEILFNGLLRYDDDPELKEWLAGHLAEEITIDICDDQMRKTLVKVFHKSAPSKTLILLIAKSGADKYLKQDLKQLAFNGQSIISDPLAWGALIALARSGDNDAVRKIIEDFTKAEDISYKISVLMPDLAYAPAPDVILLLKQYLENDYGFANDGTPGQIVPPANYAADALCRMLSGFPGKQDVFAYQKSDIDKCRQWMNSQKEFFHK